MKVTNVTVKLSPHSSDRLKGFGTMTLDNEFVVRDLKIIEGTSGLFVAMPSRKLTDHCPKCRGKNHLRAKFCNDCGARLPERRVSDEEAQGKLHADVAHPINTECRNRLQQIILEAYEEERKRAGEPGAPAAPAAEPTSSEEFPTTPLDDEVDWGDALKEDDKKEEGPFGEGKPPPPSSFGEGIV